MTAQQKQNTTKWMVGILLMIIGFLMGSNFTGWALSAKLTEHEMKSGHTVMESRMNRVDKDIEAINDKLDQILKEVKK